MNRTNWELVEVAEPPSGWIKLEDSTWDALIAGLAGNGNVVRCLRDASGISGRDQGIIDSTIDDHLAAADIPPRPRGYDWYLRPPRDVPDLRVLHGHLNEYISMNNPEVRLPLHLREVLEAALLHLYP